MTKRYQISAAEPPGSGFFVSGPGDIIFHLNTNRGFAEWIASKLDAAFEAGIQANRANDAA